MDVPAPDDPRIMVTIPVPVKGQRKPLVLTVPRFDFLDEPTYDAITAELDAIAERTDLVVRKATRLINLAYLKPCIPERQYEVCETLPVGQLNAIMAIWSDASQVSLGEYLASANSSTGNTGAPSSTTSSPVDTPDATSDAA